MRMLEAILDSMCSAPLAWLGGGILAMIFLVIAAYRFLTADESCVRPVPTPVVILVVVLGLLCMAFLVVLLLTAADFALCLLVVAVAPVVLVWWLGILALQIFRKIFFVAGLLCLCVVVIGGYVMMTEGVTLRAAGPEAGALALTGLFWYLHHKAEALFRGTCIFIKQVVTRFKGARVQ